VETNLKWNYRISFALLSFILATLWPGLLLAQAVSDRFKQIDKDGDGKLSISEAGTLGFFKPADANRDGFVTLEEAEAFSKKISTPSAVSPIRNSGMEGDGAAPVFHWPVPASRSPSPNAPYNHWTRQVPMEELCVPFGANPQVLDRFPRLCSSMVV
jgi:hypothetical protein